jgi:anti-sigma factor RsiW
MNQHVLNWLPAYHDGELSPSHRRQVEDHLATCPTCLADLETLDSLSGLLRANQAPELTSPERFAAQVQLLLPRSPQPATSTNEKTLPRWVLGAPLALIAAWAFLQAALWITTFLLGANWALGPQNLLFPGWAAPVDLIETAGSLLVMYFGLMVATTILWCTWMAFWLVWKNNQNLEPGSHRI